MNARHSLSKCQNTNFIKLDCFLLKALIQTWPILFWGLPEIVDHYQKQLQQKLMHMNCCEKKKINYSSTFNNNLFEVFYPFMEPVNYTIH